MSFSLNACYAALRSTNTKTVDEAFGKMLIALIEDKGYVQIDIGTIIKDFKEEFGFELPYFPMLRLLAYLCEKKILRKSQTGIQSWNIIGRDESSLSEVSKEFWNTVKAQECQYEKLLRGFIKYYSEKYKENLDIGAAKRIVDAFVEESGFIYLQKHSVVQSSTENYRFCSYLKEIEQTDDQLYTFVDSTIVGRILSELIVFTSERETAEKVNARVFLDTNIIFRLLGIGSVDQSEYYKKLIQDMKQIGFQPYVFQHTYSEVVTILSNSAYWIGNYQYDPSKASETTYYFVTNNRTKEDVENKIATLEKDLGKMGIRVYVGGEYPQKLPMGVLDEKTCYTKIIEYYKQTNPQFDEADKKETVIADAKSFFLTDFLNNGIPAENFIRIANVFITHNGALSHVAKNLCDEKSMATEHSIPYCVSDLFWGNLIWANSSASLDFAGRQRLNSIVNAAFTPSNQMLHKLKDALDELMNGELIPPDICYFLKSDRLALKMLMDVTEGDDNKFTEHTPLEILKQIREKARREGVDEEKERGNIKLTQVCYEQKKGELEQENRYFQQLEQEKSDIQEQMEIKTSNQGVIKKKIEQFDARASEAVKKAKKDCEKARVLVIMCMAAYIIGGLLLLIKFNVLYGVLELAIGVIVVIFGGGAISSWLFNGMEINSFVKALHSPSDLENFFVKRNKKETDCEDSEKIKLTEELQAIQGEIDALAKRNQENYNKREQSKERIERLQAELNFF